MADDFQAPSGSGVNNSFFLPTMTTAQRVAVVLRLNEWVLDLTDHNLYRGDGSTFGGVLQYPSSATIEALLAADAVFQAAVAADAVSLSGKPFRKTTTLTSAAAATPVHILTDAEVGTGKVVYVEKVLLTVNGVTAWTDTTGTVVKIQDTAATLGLTFPKSILTGDAVLGELSTSVVISPAILLGSGFTSGKGLDIVADHVFAAGDDIVVTVFGYIA